MRAGCAERPRAEHGGRYRGANPVVAQGSECCAAVADPSLPRVALVLRSRELRSGLPHVYALRLRVCVCGGLCWAAVR